MRRTTIALEDDLFRSLKQQAAKDGVTLGSLVNRLLRKGIRSPSRGEFKLRLTTVKGRLRPGVDLEDKDALFDLMDGTGQVITIDANVLVYAHRSDSPMHAAAVRKFEELAKDSQPIALTWTVIYQFLRVVTHPSVFKEPSSIAVAWRFCSEVLAIPNAVVLSETERHAEVLDRLLADVEPTGNLVHDAHIAAVMIEHGVRDIVSNDDDFSRFPSIRVIGLD